MLCIAALLVVAAGQPCADDCSCCKGRDGSCQTHDGHAAPAVVAADAASASCCQHETPAPAVPEPVDDGVSSVCPCCPKASPEAVAQPSRRVHVPRVTDVLDGPSALMCASTSGHAGGTVPWLTPPASGPPVYLSNCTLLL